MFEHRKQPFVRCSVTLQGTEVHILLFTSGPGLFYDCEVKSYRSIMRYLRYKCTFNSVATILERWRMFHNLRIWAATNVSGLPVWPAIWKADIGAKASSASDHSSKREILHSYADIRPAQDPDLNRIQHIRDELEW